MDIFLCIAYRFLNDGEKFSVEFSLTNLDWESQLEKVLDSREGNLVNVAFHDRYQRMRPEGSEEIKVFVYIDQDPIEVLLFSFVQQLRSFHDIN